MESKINEIYNDYMKILKPYVGNGVTYGDDLEKIGKKLFGNKFIGVFPSDKLPHIKNGMYIANLDKSDEQGSHWISVYVKNGKSHIFDSFGRKSENIIPSIYEKGSQIIDADYDAEQKKNTNNCGLHSITALYMYNEFNPNLISKYL